MVYGHSCPVNWSFCTKVIRNPQVIEISFSPSLSFTPGFSQVNCAKAKTGNRLNGFLFS
jgi:hypothetical protein